MDEEQIREIVREELAGQDGGDEQGGEQPQVGRRGVLGSLAAAAGLGAAGYYAIQPVAASTHSGEVGTPNKLQRIWAETIRDGNDDAMLDFTGGDIDASGNDLTNVGAATVESLGNERHYAGAYSGSDPDARLDNALLAASDGDMIQLENAVYSSSHTVSKKLSLIGSNMSSPGTENQSTITLSANESRIVNIRNTGTITIDGNVCRVGSVENVNGSVDVNGGRVVLTGVFEGSITFDSASQNGVVDASTQVSVTDNGANTIGDIA